LIYDLRITGAWSLPRKSHIVNRKYHALLAGTLLSRYIIGVKGLTKQEQLVLCIVLGLLLTGWAVKTYRAAHPATPVTHPAGP
jgi:hypothetical protein